MFVSACRGWLVGWLVGLVLVCVCLRVCLRVCVVCSFRGLFACVLSWVEILYPQCVIIISLVDFLRPRRASGTAELKTESPATPYLYIVPRAWVGTG